jgi:uronate dehydrogenase
MKDLAQQCVVLTGAAGRIGSVLRRALAPLVAELRLSDVASIGELAAGETFIAADLQDAAAIERLSAGADAVIHLGGVPGEVPFEELVGPNLRGAFAVYEAARRQGVGRVVFASSNHVTGFYDAGTPLTGAEPPRPDSLYGSTKAFGEALGRLYVDKFGLDVIAVRIGAFESRPSEPRHRAVWLSHDDAARLFTACLTVPPGLGFHIVYGVSANTGAWWPSAQGDAVLGYHPADDAADHPIPDGPGPSYQGGRFTDPSHGDWA